MAKKKLTLQIKVPWYASVYLNSVIFFAYLFGLEPDSEKCAARFSNLIKATGGCK